MSQVAPSAVSSFLKYLPWLLLLLLYSHKNSYAYFNPIGHLGFFNLLNRRYGERHDSDLAPPYYNNLLRKCEYNQTIILIHPHDHYGLQFFGTPKEKMTSNLDYYQPGHLVNLNISYLCI